MILGIGSDLCSIERIEQSLERHGARFVARIFTEAEQALAESRPQGRAATYAKRFAAKEALAKALGTGIAQGVFMCDIGVVNSATGAPTLALSGGARARLDAMTPRGHQADIHLSLSDDPPWAQAFVILSARPIV